jgi:MYXO-CTERM domain-containing protein
VQDFQDCYYRLPTPQELKAQFDRWSHSKMSGYFVFSWNYQPADKTCLGTSLESHPDHMAELKSQNSRRFNQPRIAATNQASPSISVPLLLGGAAALIVVAAVALRQRRRRR